MLVDVRLYPIVVFICIMWYLDELKNYRMISVCFQGKPYNITVIQAYAPTSNAEEAEVEGSIDLQDLLELTPKKMSFSL